MSVTAPSNEVSNLITALESRALARLADASADDFVLAARTKDGFDALVSEDGDRWRAIASHFSLPSHQVTDFNDEYRKTKRVSFSRVAAAVLGCTPRTVEHAVQIGAGLSAESVRRLREAPALNTALYRNKRELLALCRHTREAQKRILDQIEKGRADNVAEAETRLKLRTALPKAAAQLRAMQKRWKQQSPEVRRDLIVWLVETGELDRILAGLNANDESASYRDYISAADIAEARLPDLPHSKKGVLERALKAGWAHIEAPGRGGVTRLFEINALPLKARDELIRRRAISDARNGAAPTRQDGTRG